MLLLQQRFRRRAEFGVVHDSILPARLERHSQSTVLVALNLGGHGGRVPASDL